MTDVVNAILEIEKRIKPDYFNYYQLLTDTTINIQFRPEEIELIEQLIEAFDKARTKDNAVANAVDIYQNTLYRMECMPNTVNKLGYKLDTFGYELILLYYIQKYADAKVLLTECSNDFAVFTFFDKQTGIQAIHTFCHSPNNRCLIIRKDITTPYFCVMARNNSPYLTLVLPAL